MKSLISIFSLIFCFSLIGFGQNQKATIKIEKIENGNTTIIEKEIELTDGQDFNSILQELGVLDDLGNLKEGQSFEINVKKKDGLQLNEDITIEYFDAPNINLLSETKAFLGVMLTEHQGEGVLIKSIVEDTKAQEAGLLPGDILISVDGDSYDTVGSYVQKISSYNAGDEIDITYERDGELKTMSVELGEKAISSYEKEFFLSPDDMDFPGMQDDDVQYFEWHSDDNGMWPGGKAESEQAFLGVSPGYHCTDKTEGVPIGEVTANSSAEEMGILKGDIITGINGRDMDNFADISETIDNLNPGDEIKITLNRDGKKIKVKGNLGSRAELEQGNMFGGFPGQENMDFEFRIDSDNLPEEFEDMFQRLENLNFENLSEEEMERQLEEMLFPLIQEFESVTEEITIGISVLTITEDDLNEVNKNAQVELSMEDDLAFDYISYFPNPMNGEFNLTFNLSDSGPYKVLVYDQVGRTVFEDVRSLEGEYTNNIDLNGLSSGPYYLQIVQGQNTYSRKIIKE